MRIKSITIEGMHNVLEKTYTFNQLNYLYGPNGTGKSTALQAIQLALLGYIPGVNKTNAAIFKHARKSVLSVTCIIDNEGQDIKITRTWSGSLSSVNKTFSIIPEGYQLEKILADIELPIFNFKSFLELSANQLKDWFINFLPKSGEDNIDWKRKFDEELEGVKIIDEDLLPDILSDILRIGGSGIDSIRAVNTYLKDRVKYEKANLSRNQSTIESLILYDDCEEDNVEEVSDTIKKLQSQLMKAAEIERIKAENIKVNARLNEIKLEAPANAIEEDSRYIDIKTHIEDKQECLIKLESEIINMDTKINDIKSLIQTKKVISDSQGICPYTKSVCEDIKERSSQAILEIEELQKEADDLVTKLSNLVTKKDNLNLDIYNLREKQESLVAKYATKSQLSNSLQIEEFIDGEDKSVDDIKEELDELQEKLTKMSANRAYTEMSDKLTAEKFKIENSIGVLKKLVILTDANHLQSEYMKNPFEDLSSEIDKYLHLLFDGSISSMFELSDKSNSFSFGIMRDDKYISYDMLSSGEKCIYTLALMMCIVEQSKCPIKLILIDDLLDHLDDANANQVFKSLQKIADIQIILAGVKEYSLDNFKDIVIELR